MRRVVIPRTEVATTSIGYGCSQLMSRIGRAESVRLLDVAFDAGIRHFDVARAYGQGDAESALGDFLRRRRDEVTVATKLGLEPPRRTRRLALAKAVARAAVAAVPPLRRLAREGAARMTRTGRFSVPEARASLERSLGELRTDRVDLLLLHECGPSDLSDELLGFLQECVSQGKVRSFGIATVPEASRRIVAERPEFAPVVQLENSVVAPTVRATAEHWRDAGVITHSPIRGLEAVRRRTPGRERAELAELMLAWACAANPDGVVLFSSCDPEHIRRNAALELSPERVERAERLAAMMDAWRSGSS